MSPSSTAMPAPKETSRWLPIPSGDPRTERLCPAAENPESVPDKVRIRCRLEGGDYRTRSAPGHPDPVILAFNIERGALWREQVAWIAASGIAPDILLLSEVDRGCERTGYVDVADLYARALSAEYAYGVEFVELPEEQGGPPACEIGNAIISRYPLYNVRLLRFAENHSWYFPIGTVSRKGERRLGGRMAVVADILVKDRWLRVYSVHLESDFDANAVRLAQARELAEDAARIDYGVVIAGDFNAAFYMPYLVAGGPKNDPAAWLVEHGFTDAHMYLAPGRRATTAEGLILDLIVGRNVDFSAAKLCDRPDCRNLSDHLPIWATVRPG